MRKRIETIVALALVVGTASLSPASSQPMMSAADILHIHGCAAQPAYAAQTFTDYFGQHVTQLPTSPMLMVDFENSSSKPISSVEIAYLQNNKVSAVVRDDGDFAPHVAIMHAFFVKPTALLGTGTSMSCVPLRVRYADGTAWTNPQAPAIK